ncbi:MAG: hypothetical protein N4A49_01705 [Marinifilaceae bacterium]|nr:hypothetical protein [Marinifilaceae bacterium]
MKPERIFLKSSKSTSKSSSAAHQYKLPTLNDENHSRTLKTPNLNKIRQYSPPTINGESYSKSTDAPILGVSKAANQSQQFQTNIF